jgi:DNA-3-methyladenine glycosylase I
MDKPTTCSWPTNDPLMIVYHDKEWGVPLHDDQKLFEFMLLDAFQAGLSWKTILHRREGFRRAFAGFDPMKVAAFDEKKILELIQDTGIIRNQSKIRSSVSNAQAFLKVQEEFGAFDKYIWQFTEGKTIQNKLSSLSEIPVSTKESDAMSRDLKKRGFKFVGTTICYAFMQAAGMVNDHLVYCRRYREVAK